MNDYATLLTPAERQRVEAVLAAGEAATGAQMVVAIFPSLEGESLEDVSIRLAERWRIGQRGLDNGVILVMFLAERRMRLEVGYGLEPVIPDAVAGRIVAEVLAPHFREGRYAAGLEAAARAVYERIERRPASQPGGAGARGWVLPAFLGLLAVVAVLLAWETMSLDRRQRRRHYTLGPRGGFVPRGREWYGPRGPWIGGFPRGGAAGGGGGFSGGGGAFGGGGASGRW